LKRRVTALEGQKRSRGRINVQLDGEFAFGLDQEVALESGLKVGDLLEAEEIDRLVEEDGKRGARARALRFLQPRERSRAEVDHRLQRYGYVPSVITAAVEYLERLGYLDDQRFAQTFIREKSAGGWGPRRLREELYRKGVDPGLTEEVLVECLDEGADARYAHLVVQVRRRFGPEYQRDPTRARRRAGAFLARRGHDWAAIARVLAGAFAAEADGGGESAEDPFGAGEGDSSP